MLAVDREQEAASPTVRGYGQLARRDQALLVRERERDPPLERPQGRLDAGKADDGVENDVGSLASRICEARPPTWSRASP